MSITRSKALFARLGGAAARLWARSQPLRGRLAASLDGLRHAARRRLGAAARQSSSALAFFRRRSLVSEILALQIVFALIVGLLAFGGVWWSSGWVIEDNIRKWGEQWISSLDELGMPLYVSQDEEKYVRIESYVEKFPEISFVRYYSSTGEPIFTDFPHRMTIDVPAPAPGTLLGLVNAQATEAPYMLERLDSELPIVRIVKPIWTESLRGDGLIDLNLDDAAAVEETLVGFVELGLDFGNYQAQLTRNIVLGSVVSLAVLLFLTVASWFIYRRALLPLSQLQRPLRQLAEGQTDFSVRTTGHTEIRAIANALNSTVSALNERDKRLWQLANHDPLTGLVNRHRFSELLDEEVDRASAEGITSALLFIDLDQFKYVNDTVGHTAGDRLLKSVGDRLRDGVRETDIVSRFGGDEFVVLLSDINREDVEAICDELVQGMREYRFVESGDSFTIPCSIGVTMFDNDNCSPADLLAQADMACHHAKARGRNRFHVYTASGTEMRHMMAEMSWSQQIQEALREDLFVLRYQPIVDVNTGEPVLYEVLLRMQPKHQKLILPSAFLPAAKRFGLMTEIDEWVIRNALKQLARFRAKHGDVRFTVNVSGNIFETPHLFQCLEESLEHYDVPLDAIVLEITEQIAVANMGSAGKQIAELSKLGFKFAIDDFGAGYSSYNYLKTLPVDYIKIDGAFISELSGDDIDQAIVSSITQIAQATDKKTIAEHVGDHRTFDVLRTLEVDYAQGYFLGKPAPTLSRERVRLTLATPKRRRRSA